jgi:hypothetical protein
MWLSFLGACCICLHGSPRTALKTSVFKTDSLTHWIVYGHYSRIVCCHPHPTHIIIAMSDGCLSLLHADKQLGLYLCVYVCDYAHLLNFMNFLLVSALITHAQNFKGEGNVKY